MSTVTFAQHGAIAKITLNRPDKLNAFSAELVHDLTQAISKAVASGARLALFQAEGKGFSGGFDLSSIEQETDGDLVLRFIQIEQMLQAVYHAPLATMAIVHGACYGAAADLVAACQWRVATSDARFRIPGPRFGLALGTRRLAELVGEDRYRQLVLRTKPFDAAEALCAGVITHIAGQEEWESITQNVLAEVSALDPLTFTRISSQLRREMKDADLAELVRSATDGSVKARILAYLDEMAAIRASHNNS